MSGRFLTAAAVCALLAPAAAHAQSETRASADIYVSGGYSDNPFSSPNGQGSAFGSVAVRPKVAIKSARSTFTIDGDVSLQEYAEHYSLVDSYTGRLRYDGTPSERIQTNAQVSYTDRFIGAFDYMSDTGDISEPDPVIGSDLGLVGTRSRRSAIEGQGGITGRLSERGELAVTVFGADVGYSQANAPQPFDYTSFGGSLGYSHKLNEHSDVGIRLQVSSTNYESILLDDTDVYSAQVTGSTALNERWKLNGSVGVSVAKSPGADEMVSLTGSLGLCNTGERTNFCLRASRSVLPSGVLGTVTENRAEANFNRRVSEHGTVTASASFIHTKTELGATGFTRDYGYGSVGYTHRLTERLSLSASTFYRAVGQGLAARGDDFGGQVGLVYRLGDTR